MACGSGACQNCGRPGARHAAGVRGWTVFFRPGRGRASPRTQRKRKEKHMSTLSQNSGPFALEPETEPGASASPLIAASAAIGFGGRPQTWWRSSASARWSARRSRCARGRRGQPRLAPTPAASCCRRASRTPALAQSRPAAAAPWARSRAAHRAHQRAHLAARAGAARGRHARHSPEAGV